jgi:predicted permease
MVLDPQPRRFCFTNSSIISLLLAVCLLLASEGLNFLARDLFRITSADRASVSLNFTFENCSYIEPNADR